MERVHYFTKEDLLNANKEAVNKQFNRQLEEEKLIQLDETFKFPVVYTILDKTIVRCGVILDDTGIIRFIDVTLERFMNLSFVKFPSFGLEDIFDEEADLRKDN